MSVPAEPPTAAAIAARVRAGSSDAAAEVEAAIARAGQVNDQLRAIVNQTGDRARTAAVDAPTDGDLAG
ncbi:MAG: hypothetical protein AAFN30_12870, partial [Actinomycetota bacterium]